MLLLFGLIFGVKHDDVFETGNEVAYVERLVNDRDKAENHINGNLAEGLILIKISLCGSPNPISNVIKSRSSRLFRFTAFGRDFRRLGFVFFRVCLEPILKIINRIGNAVYMNETVIV